jgi:hypothetical protein
MHKRVCRMLTEPFMNYTVRHIQRPSYQSLIELYGRFGRIYRFHLPVITFVSVLLCPMLRHVMQSMICLFTAYLRALLIADYAASNIIDTSVK